MYTALYRQWRPNSFEEVVGQDAIVRTLKNQIKTGRIAHAYLFCGARGTGKTSIARIFARAVNCVSPVDSSPCGQCEVCTGMTADSYMNIFEIDAASNNSVDDVRDLREKVAYPPTLGKYKVYIIDEVHMLSASAFNALLKTLEEPPAHVIFILATTESHKLPSTILSRCQRYDFKRISGKVIVDRLKYICDKIGVTVDEEGFYTIARWAEGGMRDALSLLDQCIGYCGNSFTNGDILDILGSADQGFIFDTMDDIIGGNIEKLFIKIDALTNEGKDLSVFLRDLVNHIRKLLIVKLCDNPEPLLDAADSTIDRLKEQAAKASEARLARALDILSSAEANIKTGTHQRLLFELVIIKICRPSDKNSLDDLADRIEVLEKTVSEGNIQSGCNVFNYDGFDYIPFVEGFDAAEAPPVPADKKAGKPEAQPESQKLEAQKPAGMPKAELKPEADKSPGAGEGLRADEKSGSSQIQKDIASLWPEILKAVKKERLPIYMILKDGKPSYDGDGTVTLIFSPDLSFNAAAVEKENNRAFIEDTIGKVTGKQVRIKCSVGTESHSGGSAAPSVDHVVDKAYKLFGKDIVEVVDE